MIFNMKPIFFAFFITMVSVSFVYSAPIDDPGSRGVDWDQVREKVEKHEWAASLVQELEKGVLRTMQRYDHPPLGKTGWLHEYFCDDDAQRLRFDPEKPHEHVCTECGKVYSGSPYDDCWRSLVHSEISSAAADAAALFRVTGESRFFDYTKKVLIWYAEHFDQFEPHGKHAGKGIIREQSLDEATQLVRIVQAYWDICSNLQSEDREKIVNNFLLPDAKFIHSQTGTIHNIHSWHNAAVGLVGFAVGDEELVRKAIDGPYGLKQQIQKGVKDDGFWFEGSISYHFYTISSLQPLYLAAKSQGYDLTGTEKFYLMYTAPIQFTFPNGEFPANNDGWPGQSLQQKISYYEIACGLWEDDILHQTLSNLYQEKRRTSENALLYGPEELPAPKPLPRQSVLFKESGIGFLRNDSVNVYLKFGPYGGGHDHLDRLNMILYTLDRVVMPDLGTSGYGIPLNRWYRSPAAHNMLVVNGKRQARCDGYLVSFDDNRVEAGVKEAYENVDIKRTIRLNEDEVLDHIRAVSKESNQYDLFYHIRGTLADSSIPLKEAEKFNKSNGYEYLQNIQTAQSDGEVQLTWDLRDVKGRLTLVCTSQESYHVFVGTCPDNPANQKLGFLLLRCEGKQAEWDVKIEVESHD